MNAEVTSVSAGFQAEEVSRRLSPSGPGWATVWSHSLGGAVVFLRDEDAFLAPQLVRLVTYTKTELAILSTGTEGSLREIHRAKKILPGRVTSLRLLVQVEVTSLQRGLGPTATEKGSGR